jgi:hypothetical protein
MLCIDDIYWRLKSQRGVITLITTTVIIKNLQLLKVPNKINKYI